MRTFEVNLMSHDIDDLKLWNRIILNMVWYIIGLSVAAEIIGLVYDSMLGLTVIDEINHRLVFPTLWLILITLSTEIIVRLTKRFADYCILIMGSLIPTVLIIYFSHIPTIHNILFLSILIAAFYYKRWKIYLSCTVNISLFLVLYNYNHTLNATIDGHEMIVSLFIFLTCALLSLGIMSRGTHLLNQLNRTMEEQKKLLIRNVTMDRITKIDALTELYNHKTFHEYLDRLIDQSERTGLRLHLAMLDIDNFKKVNDTYGHQVGDIVLSKLADCLRETVSPNDFISRYGGEEFAIIFVDQSDEEALASAERIRSKVSEMVISEMNDQSVSISVGLQAYVQGTGKEILFRNADTCLYEAKRTGKNKVVVHLPSVV
jgi:diguanylate cyclase (GGDEF)-like protein